MGGSKLKIVPRAGNLNGFASERTSLILSHLSRLVKRPIEFRGDTRRHAFVCARIRTINPSEMRCPAVHPSNELLILRVGAAGSSRTCSGSARRISRIWWSKDPCTVDGRVSATGTNGFRGRPALHISRNLSVRRAAISQRAYQQYLDFWLSRIVAHERRVSELR